MYSSVLTTRLSTTCCKGHVFQWRFQNSEFLPEFFFKFFKLPADWTNKSSLFKSSKSNMNFFNESCTLKKLPPLIRSCLVCSIKKQPPRSILWKRCSENMQQIYRGTSMPKCNFNKVKQLYSNRTSAWVFSCKFAAYFQNTFPKNNSGRLLLGVL